MEPRQRKNATRRKLTVTSKHDKFISSYLKAKHPEVYNQADQLYVELDEKYPMKRDLRKTLEFLHVTAGINNINEYYYDHIYEDLVRELRNDPDLKAIFDDMNDINLSEEHQTVAEIENIIQDMCQNPDTNMDEPTPLEWELYTLGY